MWRWQPAECRRDCMRVVLVADGLVTSLNVVRPWVSGANRGPSVCENQAPWLQAGGSPNLELALAYWMGGRSIANDGRLGDI